MKLVFIILIFSAAMMFECKKNNKSDGENLQNTITVYSGKKQVRELEISISAKILKKGLHDSINYINDNLYIEYEIKNKGNKDFVIYNRGHFGFDDTKNPIYVEPADDGIEISQKAFDEPKDKQCPMRLVAIVPQGSILKAQKTMKQQMSLELPPKLNTPYANCKPSPVMPDKIEQAKFCVGVAEIRNRSELKVNEKGIVRGQDGLTEQKLLCSDTIDLR